MTSLEQKIAEIINGMFEYDFADYVDIAYGSSFSAMVSGAYTDEDVKSVRSQLRGVTEAMPILYCTNGAVHCTVRAIASRIIATTNK